MISRIATLAALMSLAAGVAAAQPRPAEVIGLPKAVAVAETVSRGRVLEAEMDYEKGRLVYETKAVVGKGVQEILIDALSGEVVAQRPHRVSTAWRTLRDADQLHAVRAAATPLSQMLTRIEAERKTRVTEVSLEREQGQTYYEVELADDRRTLLVDPRTGAVRYAIDD